MSSSIRSEQRECRKKQRNTLTVEDYLKMLNRFTPEFTSKRFAKKFKDSSVPPVWTQGVKKIINKEEWDGRIFDGERFLPYTDLCSL